MSIIANIRFCWYTLTFSFDLHLQTTLQATQNTKSYFTDLSLALRLLLPTKIILSTAMVYLLSRSHFFYCYFFSHHMVSDLF